MAIAIKSIPVLDRDAAIRFNSKADAVSEKKATVKFSKQIQATSRILAKAKI